MTILEDIIDAARDYAETAHRGQVRKVSGKPYTTHTRGVASLVRMFTRDKDTIAAAHLHDVIEDTPVTKKDIAKVFNSRVADYVEWLTNPPGNKTNHIKKIIQKAPWSVVVIKVADRIYNLNDSPNAQRAWESSKAIYDELVKRSDSDKKFLPLLKWYEDSYKRVFGA